MSAIMVIGSGTGLLGGGESARIGGKEIVVVSPFVSAAFCPEIVSIFVSSYGFGDEPLRNCLLEHRQWFP